MSEIRIGLAGLGRFGRLHASVLSTTPGAVLAAVCDPLESELEEVAGRYELPDRFTDYETMLAEAPLDCVSLATPEPLHAEMVRAALEHGLHVFVEKPLATDHQEARRVADAAAHAGLHVQVGFVLRFDPLHAYVREQRLHERPEGSYWPELHGRITGALREELTDFVECVRAGRPSDVASLDDAVEGLRIADAVVASAEAGAEVALD